MKGKITKIEQQGSAYGGKMWFLCFKMEDGHSARAYIQEKFGNFKRWGPCLSGWQRKLMAGEEVWLGNLRWYRNPAQRMVDGDSLFEILKEVASEKTEQAGS